MCFENWKKEIEIWCALTEIPKEKRALIIHLSLENKARIASSEIGLENLSQENGVEILLEKLDSLFLVDKGQREFAAVDDLFSLYRKEDANVNSFVTEFEHTYFKFKQQGMSLPDSAMAYILLRACKLTDGERKLIMSAINNVSYDNMKSAIKRIFCNDINKNSDNSSSKVIVKNEPIFYGNDENEVMYARNNFRGRFSRRTNNYRGRGGGAILTGSNREQVGRGGRRQNPLDAEGNISKCLICDSRFHWARQCPDAYEKMNESDKDTNNEMVHLSLFIGYAQNDKKNKLVTLLKESNGCAVLDCGCSTTVCGEEWLNNYVGGLSDYERSKIIEDNSNSTFTFGDGTTIRSIKRVILLCYIGNKFSNITTDVVSYKIPLLLSKLAMKKGKMCLDFGNDTLKIGGDKIKLHTSSSGHYLLPLSF